MKRDFNKNNSNDKYNYDINTNYFKEELKKYNNHPIQNYYNNVIDENDEYINSSNNSKNKIDITNNKGDKKRILIDSNINFRDKYDNSLEKIVSLKNEINELKKKIEKLEKEKNSIQKESLFHFKSLIDNSDYEEEIDIVKLKEGVRKKNRSEDLEIDFPGFNKRKK